MKQKIEHVFRHEYGFLVASLVSRFGLQQLESIEDAIQWAMTQAITTWSKDKHPDNPQAWLYQVAARHLLSELTSAKRRHQLASQIELPPNADSDIPFTGELSDSFLRMLFIASDPAIPAESQLVFVLKSLCGFSTPEIAHRLFISEANVYKRFHRAKAILKRNNQLLDSLTDAIVAERLPAIHDVLYLIFTEGYLSSHQDHGVRKELCEESLRLTQILITSDLGKTPEGHALMALILFHLARLDARQDNLGLVLLEHQDRKKWDKQQIQLAFYYLQTSASGEKLSRYHIEASIAAEHCLADSFAETRWDKIAQAYALLLKVNSSPVHMLGQAIAVAEWQSPSAALAMLASADMPAWLTRSYHWYAVLADLQIRCEQPQAAEENREKALNLAPTNHIRKLLEKRLQI